MREYPVDVITRIIEERYPPHQSQVDADALAIAIADALNLDETDDPVLAKVRFRDDGGPTAWIWFTRELTEREWDLAKTALRTVIDTEDKTRIHQSEVLG